MEKQIKEISQKQLVENSDGFTSVDMFHTEHNFEPFLVFTEFHMDRLIFGPHPHAGISVMTYMMPDSEGSFINRDSRGDNSIIEPGGLHITQAGSGVKHVEYPSVAGTDCHGFQIWINHSDTDRLVAPDSFHASAADIPEWRSENIVLRVIQGSYLGISSPIKLVTETCLFHALLEPNSEIEFDASEMAFIYNVSGELFAGGQKILPLTLVLFKSEGDKVKAATGNSKASFLFASGTPHNEPIVQGGPFVMTTDEQMNAAFERLRRGEMGELI
jgi:redox-sensitive bicupin YhaK (pirin superfamily)